MTSFDRPRGLTLAQRGASQPSLFPAGAGETEPQPLQAGPLNLPGADISYYPDFIGEDRDQILAHLIRDIAWEQRSIVISGRSIPQPRLVAWHGEPDAAYAYSGVKLAPAPWTPYLLDLKAKIEALTGEKFNSVLLNYYRTGRDSVGMHSDNEPELGRTPAIASVSLGAVRTFELKPKYGGAATTEIPLAHGSLLLMRGDTQRNYLHGIPKVAGDCGPRVNLTFRKVIVR